MSKLIWWLIALAFTLTAQPVFVAEGNYNPYDANKSPLLTWDGTTFARANVLTGYSMQTPRAVQSFRGTNGKVYVVTIQPFYSNNFFIFEYTGGQFVPVGQTLAGDGNGAAWGFVLSPDCTRAYVLNSSGQLWPVNIANLASPVVGTPIAVPGGQKLDIRPQGDRILVTGYGAVVHDVNLLTGSVTTLNLNLNYFQPQIRISPDGAFAYFGLEDAAHSFVVLNTATYPATLLKVEPGPGGNFGMVDLAFHPTLKRAYFMSWPSGAGSTGSLYMIDTNTHTAIGFVGVTPTLAPYQMTMEPDGSRIWMAGAYNDYKFYRIPVDANGIPQPADVSATIPGITTAVYGLSVVRTPIGTSPSFLPALGARSGPQAARVWKLQVRNTGPVAVFNTQVLGVTLTQTAGPACSPSILMATPIAYGNIGPGLTVSNDLTINFTGCATTVRFKVEAALGGQSLIVANNQLM